MNDPIYYSIKDMANMVDERNSWRMTAADAARDVIRLRDGMELAWGLIANAWDVATEVNGWEAAAKTWRDDHWSVVARQMAKYKSEVPDHDEQSA